MNNPYADYKKKYGEPTGGESQFLKTEDGETYRLIILGDAYHFYQEYTDPTTNETKTTERYAWVVYNSAEKKVQILAKGISVFKQLFALAMDEDWGYPQYDYDIKLTHTGKLLKTEYTIVPGKKLTDKAGRDKLLAEAEKIDLKAILKDGMFIGEEAISSVLQKGTKSSEEQPVTDEVIIDDIDEEPIDLSSIPI